MRQSSSSSSSSLASSSMAPKKKSGAGAHPSTSEAPSHAAADPIGVAVASGDTNAAGDATGTGGTVVAPPVTEVGAGGSEGGKHQQDPGGHTPQGVGGENILSPPLHLTEGHNRSDVTLSGANHNLLAAPAAGAATRPMPSPGQVNQDDVPNGVINPQVHPPRRHATLVTGSRRREYDATTTSIVRSGATSRSASSSMPSTTSEAMA